MMTIEEIKEDIKERIAEGRNAFAEAVANIRGDIQKVDVELDTVRSQNEQLGKDIALIPEGKEPLTSEEVRWIVKYVFDEGERKAKFRIWMLGIAVGVLFILTWAIAHFVYG